MSNTYILRKGVAELSDLVDGFSALGNVLAQGGGTSYWLDPTDGDDSNDGKAPDRAFATLPTAYAALADGENDILYYIAGTSSISLSAQLVWSKSYAHFIGICAPTQAGQRARIFQAASATGLSPLINITGSGCVFSNLYVFQGVDNAASKVCIGLTGSRNYFENVHFAGGGHATMAIDGGASLLITGGSENTFVRCTFGVDTVAAGNGAAALVYAASGGAARNRFIGCDFTLYAGNAGAIFVELLGNSGIDRYHMFKDCTFSNLSGTSMTQAFAIAAGFDPANKRFLLKDCVSIGAGKWDNGDTGAVYGNMNAVTGADLSGVLVQIIS